MVTTFVALLIMWDGAQVWETTKARNEAEAVSQFHHTYPELNRVEVIDEDGFGFLMDEPELEEAA